MLVKNDIRNPSNGEIWDEGARKKRKKRERERGDKRDDSIAPEKDCGEAGDPDCDDPTVYVPLYVYLPRYIWKMYN